MQFIYLSEENLYPLEDIRNVLAGSFEDHDGFSRGQFVILMISNHNVQIDVAMKNGLLEIKTFINYDECFSEIYWFLLPERWAIYTDVSGIVNIRELKTKPPKIPGLILRETY